jgi:CBS domain-containing protein
LFDGMTTVRDIMSKDLVAVEPTATVAEAATVMGGHHVGSALVIEGGRPTGIFTERDVLRALGSDFDAAHHPVADWMTHDPTTVDAEADVRSARDLMLGGGFRHLPVLESGELVGIVSIRDISRAED